MQMKTTFPLLLLLALFVAVGCQQPCTKTTKQTTHAGDTIYSVRTYPNCEDTLSYSQKQVMADSSLVSEGRMENGKKEGEWVYNGYTKRVVTYHSDFEVALKEYDKAGNLQREKVFGKDSLYAEKQFHRNGKIQAESLINLDGFVTGHGVEYDTLGRKMAEGEHIAEDVLADTVYIENPNPPHNLEPVVVTENGGKHGPWQYYNGAGSHIATTNYNRGVAVWTGSLAGKWKLDSISTQSNTSSGEGTLDITMTVADLGGYEFYPTGAVNGIEVNGQGVGEGIYYKYLDNVVMYCTNNGENQRVWIRTLTPTQLTVQTVDLTFYLHRSGKD